MSEWISTKKAMKILGVGSTTVKRWADDNRLPFIRTAGGHRRFRRSAVERLMRNHDADFGAATDVHKWLRWLRHQDVAVLRDRVAELHDDFGDWFAVADFFGQVASALGQCWADGEYSIVDEHIASAKLAQALNAVSNSCPVEAGAPVCLLATLSGERHTLGLALTQLCLRSANVDALWVGTNMPVAELVLHILESEQRCQLLALSASSWQTDAVSLSRGYRDIARACSGRGVELIIGGAGAWPDVIDYGYRCHSFGGLKQLLPLIDLRPKTSKNQRSN